ncbi:MAG: hypothetical protein V5A77_06455 [Candidatus Bipolaricaulota bacterium]
MTKKFLAVTLVLVLAAGFMAVAAEHEDERPLMGSWENELTLDPDATPNVIDAFSSTLTVEYMTGGITYESVSEFDIDGYTDQTFNVDATVGLLDLSSTVNFDTQTPGLDYWKNTASLTLGGVSITDTFLLQKTSSYGAGMDLAFSGETPGGVSVNVSNYFGMEPDSSAASGYAIVTKHHPDDEADSYGASSLQYVSSVLTLDNLSLGCCDFSNETMFSEANGFEYSLFEFTIESNDWPLSLAADLKFTAQTKSIYLTPSLTTDWSCFEVYTDLSGVLGNNSPEMSGSTIDGLEVAGFAIKDVELGHVEFSSYTALGGHTLYDLYLNFGSDTPYIVGTTYDEVFRIEKLETFDLDFTLDTYFDMSNAGLFDLALFDANASYDLSSQFTLGSGLQVSPSSGLNEISLSLDYSW